MTSLERYSISELQFNLHQTVLVYKPVLVESEQFQNQTQVWKYYIQLYSCQKFAFCDLYCQQFEPVSMGTSLSGADCLYCVDCHREYVFILPAMPQRYPSYEVFVAWDHLNNWESGKNCSIWSLRAVFLHMV